MKQDRFSLAVGFLPGIALMLFLTCQRYLLGTGTLPDWMSRNGLSWVWIGAEAAIFLIPFVLLLLVRGRKNHDRVCLRLKRFPKRAVPLILTLSLALALLNVLLGDWFAGLSGESFFDIQVFVPLMERGASPGILFLAVAVLPALAGELFYHGGLMSAYESCGALPAILVSAVSFSLLSGTPAAIPGSLIAFFAFGYLASGLDSLWAGVLGHFLYGCVHLLMLYVTRAYGSMELWSGIQLVLVFLFALFLYLSMRSMELLIDKGVIRRLERMKLGRLTGKVLASPGLWMMVLLFVVSCVYA